ncbi:MAG: rRNA methyltransferase [Polaromonas sp. 39-63-203]|jgi:tRNA/rRNA methyltransferase|uniref:RNA methyltransferase n=1 Tax=Polaromonas sp. TaxID=1869339 RepID=UPI000BDCD1BC|nr:RNA methyltransferase [Polaromonas sp.]OYZ03413.1 MAG: rRNA methyltransferase [Polaromonas sp. 28-63-22]OYZ85282.1 MAG: rRNA methyltransferase [Polaromonas sp. 24-62-144]OZB02416.1 MAG: rRNA methyltransferase [Polaromonas sp. 39-63-203]HQS31385.1 RNA methyltransferase [Polaromonas sp.]HQS90714.1 RNA methyltransferase [Polaromonas sp.]
MKTRFVLINTSHAGNVGATARAMKTMGFDDLVLVAPRWANVLRREETIQRASGALDVLANARIVATLDEALDGMTHLCATAMTPRDFGPPTRAPRVHFAALMAQTRHQAASGSLSNSELLAQDLPGLEADLPSKPEGVAFLFGCERFGMQNEDVYRCHVALSIPADPQFGSLNLAAAVQLIAYDWREALGGFKVESALPERKLADAAEVAGMLRHLETALTDIGFLDPASPKKLMPRLNQLFNRAQLSAEEIHILRGVAKAMSQSRLAASTPASPSAGH